MSSVQSKESSQIRGTEVERQQVIGTVRMYDTVDGPVSLEIPCKSQSVVGSHRDPIGHWNEVEDSAVLSFAAIAQNGNLDPARYELSCKRENVAPDTARARNLRVDSGHKIHSHSLGNLRMRPHPGEAARTASLGTNSAHVM